MKGISSQSRQHKRYQGNPRFTFIVRKTQHIKDKISEMTREKTQATDTIKMRMRVDFSAAT